MSISANEPCITKIDFRTTANELKQFPKGRVEFQMRLAKILDSSYSAHNLSLAKVLSQCELKLSKLLSMTNMDAQTKKVADFLSVAKRRRSVCCLNFMFWLLLLRCRSKIAVILKLWRRNIA